MPQPANRPPLYHFPVLRKLAAYISEHDLLRPGDRVGIAVSGGADSVALLRGMLELQPELGVVLSVVHLHHGIRGSEADGDEEFVRELARRFGLLFHIERSDVPAHAQRQKQSLETAARDVRYAWFHRLMESGELDKIATAHTLDDQAETVLLRLLRGTGSRGLGGIPVRRESAPGSPMRIVRPLLGITREEIERYLRSLNQPWREDSSNQNRHHLRNRVRHELLPLLQRDYNPQIRSSLANLAEIARAEEAVWDKSVSEFLGRSAESDGRGSRIDRRALLLEPQGLRQRIIAEVAESLGIPAGYEDIGQIARILRAPGSRHRMGAGWEVIVDGKSLIFRLNAGCPVSKEYEYILGVPGQLQIPETGQCLRALMRDSGSEAVYNPATSLALERLTLPLSVRNWRPGDRYWPRGSKQSEKLKRLFQQRRILSPARSLWPVVMSGETIVWVPGFPVAHDFSAERGTAVCVEAVPSEPLDAREP